MTVLRHRPDIFDTLSLGRCDAEDVRAPGSRVLLFADGLDDEFVAEQFGP